MSSPHTYDYDHIQCWAGVVGFEVDLVVFTGFCEHTYPSLLELFLLFLTVAHLYQQL